MDEVITQQQVTIRSGDTAISGTLKDYERKMRRENVGWTLEGEDGGILQWYEVRIRAEIMSQSGQYDAMFSGLEGQVVEVEAEALRLGAPPSLYVDRIEGAHIWRDVAVFQCVVEGETLPQHYKVKPRPIGTSPYAAEIIE